MKYEAIFSSPTLFSTSVQPEIRPSFLNPTLPKITKWEMKPFFQTLYFSLHQYNLKLGPHSWTLHFSLQHQFESEAIFFKPYTFPYISTTWNWAHIPEPYALPPSNEIWSNFFQPLHFSLHQYNLKLGPHSWTLQSSLHNQFKSGAIFFKPYTFQGLENSVLQ